MYKKDILGTCALEPDFYAVSFVRKSDDLKAVQDLILTELDDWRNSFPHVKPWPKLFDVLR